MTYDEYIAQQQQAIEEQPDDACNNKIPCYSGKKCIKNA